MKLIFKIKSPVYQEFINTSNIWFSNWIPPSSLQKIKKILQRSSSVIFTTQFLIGRFVTSNLIGMLFVKIPDYKLWITKSTLKRLTAKS